MKIVLFLVQLIITGTILGFLSQRVDFGHVYDVIKNISAPTLVFALGLYCLQIILASYRLKYILRFLGNEATMVTTARSVLAGGFVGQTPLSSFGGDMVRVWTIFRDGIGLRTAASAVTIDRLFGFLGLVAINLCVLPELWLHVSEPTLHLGIVVLLGIGAFGVAVFITLQKLPAQIRNRFAFMDWIGQVSNEFQFILFAKRSSATLFMMAIATHFMNLVIIYILAQEVDMPVTFFEVLYLAPFPILASLLPVSIGGWGIREGAMVAAFSLIGIPAAKTLSASILFGLLSFLIVLPGSIVWIHIQMTPARIRPKETNMPSVINPHSITGA